MKLRHEEGNQKFKSLLYSWYYVEANGEAHLRNLAPGNTAPKKHRSGGEPLT